MIKTPIERVEGPDGLVADQRADDREAADLGLQAGDAEQVGRGDRDVLRSPRRPRARRGADDRLEGVAADWSEVSVLLGAAERTRTSDFRMTFSV